MEPILILIPIIMCSASAFLAVILYLYYPLFFGTLPTSKKPGFKGILRRKQPGASPGSPTAPNPVADTAYSLTIPKGIGTDCPPGKRGVIGYMNRWKDGEKWMWCKTDPNLGANDKLSFLSVPKGMRATVYENNYFNGFMKTFEEGEWDLHEQQFDIGVSGDVKMPGNARSMISRVNDRVSSIEIEGNPPKGTPEV